MSTEIISHRWPRRLTGLALHALMWSLPTATGALMLLKLVGASPIVADPGGPVVFAVGVVLISAALDALLSRKFPRLFPLGLAAICFDDTLSSAEKLQRLQQDKRVWQSLVSQIGFLSVLAIALLTLR